MPSKSEANLSSSWESFILQVGSEERHELESPDQGGDGESSTDSGNCGVASCDLSRCWDVGSGVGSEEVNEPTAIGEHLRLKIVETLVRIEHLPILSTEKGLVIFGQICEMVGRCCKHVGAGRIDQAQKVAETVGRAVPHAFPLGQQRQDLEDALDELIAVLEHPQTIRYH